MKKLLILIISIAFTACSEGVPDIKNLGDVSAKMKDGHFRKTIGIDSLRLDAGSQKLTFTEYLDKYCLGNDATHKNCIAVTELVRLKKIYSSHGIRSNLGHLE